MLLSRSIKSSAVSIPEFSTYPPSTRRACGLAVIQSFRKETVAAGVTHGNRALVKAAALSGIGSEWLLIV